MSRACFSLSKFRLELIEFYRMHTTTYIILLVSEMLMLGRTKVEAHVLNKLVFVTNNFVEDVIRNFLGPRQNLSK